jgi:hypothetical protein
MRLRIGFRRCGVGVLLLTACVLGMATSALAASAPVNAANTIAPRGLAAQHAPAEVVIAPAPSPSECKVVNTRTHSTSTTLQEGVEGAEPGDTLEVTGICKGDTTITSATSPLTIKGSVNHAQLNGEKQGGAVLTIDGGASVAVSGVTITGASGGYGGGVYDEGELTLTDSWVIDNVAVFGAGILDFKGGKLTLDETHVSANTATELGGGIVLGYGSEATLYHSVISTNKASGFGGGIDNIENSTLVLTGSRIEDNTATYGGGLDDNSGSLATLVGSSIAGNKANAGGGVENENGSTLTLSSTAKIVENKATGGKDHGGGILNSYSTLNLDGANVSKNTPENIFEEP